MDPGRSIDWGKTSEDYARHRPPPPDSFFHRLKAFGVGLPEQSILDLGTGTGVLARRFAQQGARACGTDISSNQIAHARELAKQQHLSVDFQVAPAELAPYPDHSFDVVTANQCWLYFDKPKVLAETKRVLKPGGCLVVSHFSWLPRLDKVARESEALLLQHNPQWTAADWSGEIAVYPLWARADLEFVSIFIFDELVTFTHESWLGRFRACRGVGASMSEEEVIRFNQAHAEMLIKRNVSDPFSVLHRLDAQIFRFK